MEGLIKSRAIAELHVDNGCQACRSLYVNRDESGEVRLKRDR
jgi:hypothetical protein